MTLPADVENKGRAFIKAEQEFRSLRFQAREAKAAMDAAKSRRDKASAELFGADGMSVMRNATPGTLYITVSTRILKIPHSGNKIKILKVQS